MTFRVENDGEKTKEIRSRPTEIRGRIAIIPAGSATVAPFGSGPSLPGSFRAAIHTDTRAYSRSSRSGARWRHAHTAGRDKSVLIRHNIGKYLARPHRLGREQGPPVTNSTQLPSCGPGPRCCTSSYGVPPGGQQRAAIARINGLTTAISSI